MAENKNINEELEEDGEEIIILADEEGKEVEFRHIATLDFEEEWYLYLHPLSVDGVDEDDMVIFHIESDADGNDVFMPVEDEELLDKLYNEYVKELVAQDDEE